jgi:hypothetical protein
VLVGRLHGRGAWAFGLTVAGFGWSLALVGAAFVVPVYSGGGSSATSNGTTTTVHTFTSSSSTLVEENGLRVLIPLAIPVALAALVWFALHRRCSRSSRWSGSVAWAAITPLAVFAALTSMSVGMFVLPTVVLLAVAAWLTPAPRAVL